MTNILAATNHVVNNFALPCDDKRCHAVYIRPVSTVGERIAEVLKALDISARELDRRSGLAEGHVSLTVARLRKNPNASVELPTLKAIAQGAKVSEAWLINGVGTPDSDDVQSLSDSHKSELRNRAGWAEAERLARQEHPDWPEWVWEATATSSPFEAPVVTVGLVLDVARLVMRHRQPPVTGSRAAQSFLRARRRRSFRGRRSTTGIYARDGAGGVGGRTGNVRGGTGRRTRNPSHRSTGRSSGRAAGRQEFERGC